MRTDEGAGRGLSPARSAAHGEGAGGGRTSGAPRWGSRGGRLGGHQQGVSAACGEHSQRACRARSGARSRGVAVPSVHAYSVFALVPAKRNLPAPRATAPARAAKRVTSVGVAGVVTCVHVRCQATSVSLVARVRREVGDAGRNGCYKAMKKLPESEGSEGLWRTFEGLRTSLLLRPTIINIVIINKDSVGLSICMV